MFHNKADMYVYHFSEPQLHDAEMFLHNGNLKGKNNDRSDVNPVHSFMKLFMFIFVIQPVWAIMNPLKD